MRLQIPLLAGAILAFLTAAAHAESGFCGRGVVGFEFEKESPNLAVLVNGVKLYDVVPSGLSEVDGGFAPVPGRSAPTLVGVEGSWAPVQCSYHTTWVASVQWTTSLEVDGTAVNVRWRTIVSVDPTSQSPDDARIASNAVEWMLEVERWPRFTSDTGTLAFGVLVRPVFDASASNGGPDFVVLPPVARYDGAAGDVGAAFCSSKDYQAAPWPPCPNRFPELDVCEGCAVAELNFEPFEHSLQYPAPSSF